MNENTEGAPLLTLENVRSGYGATEVIHGVSLHLDAGEIFSILGKNGMGKSTLLKTVMGFVRARGGRINLAGEEIGELEPHSINSRSVSYTPQEFTIFQDLTVEENLRLSVATDALFRSRVQSLSDVFPRILERLKQRAGTLSGGEQKMLLMSRAILARPRVMLVDEISEGLQPTMIEKMAGILRRHRDDSGAAILLVEQHLSFALTVADRYAVLKLGEIVEQGSTATTAASESVAAHLRV